MPTTKRRDRILIFRLTQDEYNHLTSACSEQGAGNLSSFARSQLLSTLGREPNQVEISRLNEKLESLEVQLRHATGILEQIASAGATRVES
jgi:hypothetical protein